MFLAEGQAGKRKDSKISQSWDIITPTLGKGNSGSFQAIQSESVNGWWWLKPPLGSVLRALFRVR